MVTAVVMGLLFAAFGWMLVSQGCQTVTEVRPASPLWHNRLPLHLTLLFCLLIITITDLLEYAIPDFVIIGGTSAAIVAAFFSGELQMIHIWVNWDTPMVELYGPDLPDWMKQHQHLHGLAWSLAGMLTGAALTWSVRVLAGIILGHPAVGMGDVTLMAMIGSFIGWQPVLCVLAIAPLAGIFMGLVMRLCTGRSFVAFGPHLAMSAVIVLFTWRYLWEGLALRNIFSHWPTVAAIVAGTLAAICVLLAGIRLFRMVPLDSIRN